MVSTVMSTRTIPWAASPVYVLDAVSVSPKVPKPPRTGVVPQVPAVVPTHPCSPVAKSSTTEGAANSKGHPEADGVPLGLGGLRVGVMLADTLVDAVTLVLPEGEVEELGEGVPLGDTHAPVLVVTVTASTPNAATSWEPEREQVMVMVAVGAEWGTVTSMVRAMSSPLLAAAPLGFCGAPHPPPRDVTPAPLPLSKVETVIPSTAMV